MSVKHEQFLQQLKALDWNMSRETSIAIAKLVSEKVEAAYKQGVIDGSNKGIFYTDMNPPPNHLIGVKLTNPHQVDTIASLFAKDLGVKA